MSMTVIMVLTIITAIVIIMVIIPMTVIMVVWYSRNRSNIEYIIIYSVILKLNCEGNKN